MNSSCLSVSDNTTKSLDSLLVICLALIFNWSLKTDELSISDYIKTVLVVFLYCTRSLLVLNIKSNICFASILERPKML